jgi:hypothetical protein
MKMPTQIFLKIFRDKELDTVIEDGGKDLVWVDAEVGDNLIFVEDELFSN